MKKNYKLKFLSESVLLEESGLPFINTLIIVSVTLFIVLFLIWANNVSMEDSVNLTGNIIDQAGTSMAYGIKGYATANNVTQIEENSKVYVDVPGVTGRESIRGIVTGISRKPLYNAQNTAYYEIDIRFDTSKDQATDLNEALITGMETKLEIITGSRSLLQYFLGSLYDTRVNVLK